MKKLLLASLALAVASCSSKPIEKASLEYKIFPKTASSTYQFNLAVPKVSDARLSKFVMGNDDYFDKPVIESLTNVFFEEIRASSAFNTVAIVETPVDFNPSSSQIQNIRRTTGKDAIFLVQVNKFNANVRKLSDLDASDFVNLKVFTNITYKLILTDSETVIFLTTQDTSSDKVVRLDENVYRTINELAVNNIKANVTAARNEFILTGKSLLAGDYKNEAKVAKAVAMEVEKEFKRVQEEKAQAQAQQAENKVAEEQPVAQEQLTEQALTEEQTLAEQQVQEEAPVQQEVQETPAETVPAEQATEQPIQEQVEQVEEIVEQPTTQAAEPTIETNATEVEVETAVETNDVAQAPIQETIESVETEVPATQVIETTPAEVTAQ